MYGNPQELERNYAVQNAIGLLIGQRNEKGRENGMEDAILEQLERAIGLLQATNNRLDQIEQRLDAIEGTVKPVSIDLVGTQKICDLLRVHPCTLRTYRKAWIEGVHYSKLDKEYRYNSELIRDWQRNRSNPIDHQKAIDRFLAQQSPVKRRKAG